MLPMCPPGAFQQVPYLRSWAGGLEGHPGPLQLTLNLSHCTWAIRSPEGQSFSPLSVGSSELSGTLMPSVPEGGWGLGQAPS